MASRRVGAVSDLGSMLNVGTLAGLTDGQLLERYAGGRGEAAELAFAALVARHGPLVYQICRAMLRDENDAHDAFQATFLVLIRKAGRLWVRDSIGPWLHQVACRASMSSRASAARRREHEGKAAARRQEAGPADSGDDGRCALLHQEVARLPERFRVPLLLCDLEGRTHEDAARHIGCPVGTVKSRLARGRQRLRERLARRGVAVPGIALAARSAPPPSWAASLARQAAGFGGDGAGAGFSRTVVHLASGAAPGLAPHRLAIGLVAVVATVAGAGILSSGIREAVPHGDAAARAAGRGPSVPGWAPWRHVPSPPGEQAFSTATDPRGRWVAAGWSTRAMLLDARSGKELGRLPVMGAWSVVASPDGERLAVGTMDGEVILWEVARRESRSMLAATRTRVTAVAFDRDARHLAAAGADGVVRIWPLAEVDAEPRRIETGDIVLGLAFPPDGGTLATTGGVDRLVRLWDAGTGRALRRLRGAGSPLACLAYSPDGSTLAAGGRDGAILVWEMPAGAHAVTLRGHAGPVNGLAFDRDGGRLATVGDDGMLRIWTPPTPVPVAAFRGHDGGAWSVAFGDDWLASAGDDGLRLWRPTTGPDRP